VRFILYVGWWSHWQSTGCNLLSLRPGRILSAKTHRSDPVSTRYRCFAMRSEMKRRPELVVQTLAGEVSLLAGVSWLESLCWREHGGVHFRASSPNFHWYQQVSSGVGG
jgi:hypothetical protein